MHERQIDLRSTGIALRRRSLLHSVGGVVTTALLGHRMPATAPVDWLASAGGTASASQTWENSEATPGAGSGSATPEPDDVLAINVLLEPDATLAEMAKALNARLRESYPAGYPLDESHAPHITVVQRFARAGDLDAIGTALSRIFDDERPLGWPLHVTGLEYVVLSGLAVLVINIERTPELERLQQESITAIAPLTVERGSQASFAPSHDFDPGIMDYVETFVPKATGENFRPHVTVGVAGEEFMKHLVAEPFAPFTAEVAGAAVYQLGIFGTAAKRLWEWTPR